MTLSLGTLIWCALFAAIAAAGTWVARVYALRRRLLDEPGERRSHAMPTPRGGGIAIVIAMLVAIVAMALRQPSEIVLLVCAAFGLLLVAGIGWLDDHRPLSPWSRLAVHVVASGWLMVGFYLSGRSPEVSITVFMLSLALVNIWNFMDGIDGLASTQAILVASAFSWLSWLAGTAVAVHLGLAFIAAVFGFLPFNFPRARIFLGDVGSGTLGFMLALLAGCALDGLRPAAWPLLLLPLGAFLLDAGLTLTTRMLRGERWWTAHVEHAYQRWARRAGSHARVTAGYAVWTVSGCTAMVWLSGGDGSGIVMSAVLWVVFGCALWLWLRGRPGRTDNLGVGA
jgi:UDP-N-acetylmuramyl pentapeptide phosphotransferase/UDP-N-acetylglucosamine-1-phosphate transferase